MRRQSMFCRSGKSGAVPLALRAIRPLLTLSCLVAALTLWPSPAMVQTLEPRAAGAKANLAQLQRMKASNRVVVKFREGSRVRLRAGRLSGLRSGDATGLAAALASTRVPMRAMRRLHARPEAALDAERAAGERDSGRRLADLNLYYVIDLPPGVSASAVADRLNRLAIVEFAEPGPVAPPPPVDIPPATPTLVANQGYRNAPPQGVGALDPVTHPGGDGRTMDVFDVEYSWRLDHEDLGVPASRIVLGGATALDPFSDANHGTAVLGEIVGRRNPYGVTGIAPAARAWVAPANTAEFGYDPARAIGLAAGLAGRGDVIIIEQQYWVCDGANFGPSEWLQSVFDAVSAATAKGIVVVAAAGNGGVNLDDPTCLGRFNRSVRNSRAIIVGAGSSATRARLGFSSYGSRVDVQGWGENVTTAGYGDAFNPGDERQLYTNFFSGTSSATPIVTGAVLAIQGVIKACGLTPLNSPQMRRALVSTGTPQSASVPGRIGPLPRIRQALLSTPAAACIPPPSGS